MPWKDSQPAKEGRVASSTSQHVFTHFPHRGTSACQCVDLVQ